MTAASCYYAVQSPTLFLPGRPRFNSRYRYMNLNGGNEVPWPTIKNYFHRLPGITKQNQATRFEQAGLLATFPTDSPPKDEAVLLTTIPERSTLIPSRYRPL